MIITFKEKNNKQYELQNDRVDEIFNSVKQDITNTFSKFKDNDRDLLTAIIASGSIIEKLNQYISDEFGADKIIKITGAVEMKDEKVLFKCNEDGLTEWCVARNKLEAYEYMKSLWGKYTMEEYEQLYFTDYPNKTLDDFIEYFFIPEDNDKIFTILDAGEHGEKVTKKVSEWLTDIETVPSYLCFEDY